MTQPPPHHIAVFGFPGDIAATPPDILHLINGLAARGARVDCLAHFDREEAASGLDPPVTLISPAASDHRSGSRALRDYLAGTTPDLVLTNRDWAHFEAIRVRRKLRSTVPVIFRIGSLVGEQLQRRNRLQRWKLLRRMAPAYARANGVLALSEAIARDPALARLIPPQRIAVAPNTVIRGDFLAQARADGEHTWLREGKVPVLIAVGRLVQVKDYPTLLRAFDAVRRRRPVRLIIAGEGNQRPKLESCVRHLGLTAEVDIAGFQPNPAAWMARADALVLSSTLEGLGNVLIEAMACGTPVVATDCGGPREILDNGRLGPLVPPGDHAALAAAIESVLDSPVPPERLQHAVARYHVQVAVEATLRRLASLTD